MRLSPLASRNWLAVSENAVTSVSSWLTCVERCWSVVAVVVVVGLSVAFYGQRLNFDTVGELSDNYPSARGFHLVADHFGKGQSMRTTLVIESSKTMDNNDALAVLDTITQSIRKIDGVKEVASVTEPQGKPIEDFYVSSQMATVTDGMDSMRDGLKQITDGLSTAQDKLGSADFSQVGQMADGTAQLISAVDALADGLGDLQAGLAGGGSSTVKSGIAKIESNLSTMSKGLNTLADNYTAMQAGFETVGQHYQQTAQALLGVKSALAQMQGLVDGLAATVPAVQADQYYQGLKAAVDGLSAQLGQITPAGIDELNRNYGQLTTGFGQSIASLKTMGDGLQQMTAGLNKLKSGVTTAAGGVGTVVTNMKKVSDGLADMKAGQKLLADNLTELSAFGSSLVQVTDGLRGISDGLGQSRDFLAQLGEDRIFHIPDEALTNADYQAALTSFFSADRKVTKLLIVLDDDPYSEAAVQTVGKIDEVVSAGLTGTAMDGASYGLSGQSATTRDMNDGLSRDLGRMMAIVLAGVFLVLLFVTRSFWVPVVITLSLVGTYYVAMFVTNSLFVGALHYPGVSSFIPFFSFLLIVALGVDYSIFLMMRYREYGDLIPREAIVSAARQIGGVVITAVLILGGTFATLMPSGMLLLIELATAVIVGLAVLCLVMLPLFLPAAIGLIHRGRK